MRGLFLKDLYNMGKSLKLYLIVLAVYGAISYFNGSGAFLIFVIILFAMMIPITALSLDEKDQWDVLGLTMPVTPFAMVGEKFLLILACCAVGLGGGLLASLLLAAAGGQTGIPEIVETLIPGAVMAIFYNCILLPVVYRFGSERGRILVLVLIMAPALVLMMLENQNMLPDVSVIMLWLEQTGWKYILAGVPVLFLCSFFLSLHIYRKKEW